MVDGRRRPESDLAEDLRDRFLGGLHHAPPVLLRVAHREPHIAYVCAPLSAFRREVREGGMGQGEAEASVQFRRGAVEVRRNPAPQIPRTGMEHQVEKTLPVLLQFDEVVSSAESPQISLVQVPRTGGMPGRTDRAGKSVVPGFEPFPMNGFRPCPALAHRDPQFHRVQDGPQLPQAQRLGTDIRLDRRHSATDVHAHRVRDQRVPAGDHGPDRHTEAEMAIGHQGHTEGACRVPRQVARLLHGLRFHIQAPGQNGQAIAFYQYGHFRASSRSKYNTARALRAAPCR